MQNYNHLILLGVFLYLALDLIRHKALLKETRMLILAILDSVFLGLVIYLTLENASILTKYSLLLIILGLPSLMYQFLRMKQSEQPTFIKLIRIGVTMGLMALVIIRV